MSNVKLSKSSKQKLATIKPELRKVCEKCFETLPFDVTVLEGIRTLERQKELFAAKKSKTMNSKHLTGDAVDLAPYPIDWNNKDRFHQLARHMIKAGKDVGVFVVWGGTWTGDADDKAANFYDGPHFQLV